jgi:Ca2+-binding EF-hand superfamily protein
LSLLAKLVRYTTLFTIDFISHLSKNFIFVKEIFNEIDKEADGEIYYREMVNHLQSLNKDLDRDTNPQVLIEKYKKK